MEIFEKIGEMASNTYKYTAEKADKLARETRLKIKINENKAKIEDLYNEIGETVYRRHLAQSEEDFDAQIKRDCEEIDKISEEIEQQNHELLSLRDRKECSNCYEKIEKSAKYCSNCGMEQKDMGKKEKEIENENTTESSNIAEQKAETQENEKDICNNPIAVSATEEEKASNDENE